MLCLEQGFRILSQNKAFNSLEEAGSLFWMLCEDPVVGPPLLGSAHVMGGEHRVFLSKDIHGLLKSKALLVPAAERGLV